MDLVRLGFWFYEQIIYAPPNYDFLLNKSFNLPVVLVVLLLLPAGPAAPEVLLFVAAAFFLPMMEIERGLEEGLPPLPPVAMLLVDPAGAVALDLFAAFFLLAKRSSSSSSSISSRFRFSLIFASSSSGSVLGGGRGVGSAASELFASSRDLLVSVSSLAGLSPSFASVAPEWPAYLDRTADESDRLSG